jgi:hypothetical protein
MRIGGISAMRNKVIRLARLNIFHQLHSYHVFFIFYSSSFPERGSGTRARNAGPERGSVAGGSGVSGRRR